MKEGEDIEELVLRYLDDEMSAEEASEFAQRLESDDHLRKTVDRHRAIKEDLKNIGKEEELRAKMKALHNSVESRGWSPQRRWLAIAAVIVVLVGVGSVLMIVQDGETGEDRIAQQVESHENETGEGEAPGRKEEAASMGEDRKNAVAIDFVEEDEFGVVIGSTGKLISLDAQHRYGKGVSWWGDTLRLDRVARGRTFAFYRSDEFISGLHIGSYSGSDSLFTFSTRNADWVRLEGNPKSTSSINKFTVQNPLRTGRGLPVVNENNEVVGIVSGFEGEEVFVQSISMLKQNTEMLGKMTTTNEQSDPLQHIIKLAK